MIEGRAEIEKAMDEILQKRYNGQSGKQLNEYSGRPIDNGKSISNHTRI